MMKQNELKQIISECCNDITFEYNGKAAGITSTVENYIPTFQVWYGNEIKEYKTVEDVMSDPFYDGKSLNDISSYVEYEIL